MAGLVRRAGLETLSLLLYARSGGLRLIPPGRILPVLRAVDRYGILGAATVITAARDPNGVALIDERGALSFGDLDNRTNALANEWRRRGLGPGASVAILAGNHRGFLEAVFAAGKCGAGVLLLNTGFGSVQLAEMVAREGPHLSTSWCTTTSTAPSSPTSSRGWAGSGPGPQTPAADTLDALIEHGDPSPPPSSGGRPKIVISTSGTTGVPKGAARSEPYSLIPVGGLLGKVPFRGREVTECCVPLFHSMGFSHAMYAMVLGSTLVLRRHFDPQQTLDSVAAHRASAMIVVPIMLRRILDLGPAGPRRGRSVVIAHRVRRRIPARGRAGHPRARGAGARGLQHVRVHRGGLRHHRHARRPGRRARMRRGGGARVGRQGFHRRPTAAPPGTPGRIFVGNVLAFEGYTGGGTKESIQGLMSTGDVGHFDRAGRLFIDGRDDEMIVSGGENVYPGEVEEALAHHPDIVDVAVVGVSDEEFGQRLRSYIVVRPGASLTERDVKEYVRNRLARFKIPRDVLFVDALPRNAGGKVLKRLLNNQSIEDQAGV